MLGSALWLPATHAQINVVRDLGCKLDDFTFDNGPILNAAFARIGKASLGQLNEEFYFPGGAIVFKTPLVLPVKTGISLRGNGITFAQNENAYHNLLGGPASRLIYLGPANKPAITYRGFGMKLDGLTIQRGAIPHPMAPPARDGSVAISIEGYNGIPTGKLYAPQLAIAQFNTAIDVTSIPGENHADQNQFGYLWVRHCWTVFRSANIQSVCNQFVFLSVGGYCDTVFDIRRGGDLVVDTMVVNDPALVLKLDQVEMNSNSYEIRTLKVDNRAAGWRLLEMTRPASVRVHVQGHMGRRAKPGPNPIKLLGDPKFQDVDVDLWWEGRHWPADFPVPAAE